MRGTALVAIIALASACGGESDETAPATPPALVTCDEHELALPGGSCIRPGVPTDGCAEGFAHDGVYGCTATLPVDPCPAGQMAIPGETVCRPVMDCGTGKWGDIPVDATTQYVDVSYTAGDGDGSATKPWPTINEAVTAAAAGALIAVAAGSYVEDVVIISKPVRLQGVCPELVTIVGSGQSTGCPATTLCIGSASADGTEVGGLSLTGVGHGIAMSGVEAVLIDGIRVHDNTRRGITVDSVVGASSFELRNALMEQNGEAALFVSGSSATVEASVMRGTMPDSNQGLGVGMIIQLECRDTPNGRQCDPAARATASIDRSIIEQNSEVGVFVMASDVTIDASLVRATMPRPSNQYLGIGIKLQTSCSDTTTNGTVCDPMTPASASVRGSVIEQNHVVGIDANGSDLVIDASVVRGTLRQVSDQAAARGISVGPQCALTPSGQVCDAATASSVSLTRSLVEQNDGLGLFVMGSDAIVDASVIRDHAGGFGFGLQLTCVPTASGPQCDPAARSSAQLSGSLIANSHDAGVLVIGSDITASDLVVRATQPRPSDGLFGDGFTVVGFMASASATIDRTRIEESARAGLASFGAAVSLAQSRIACADFVLNGESLLGSDFAFDDRGGNLCGCPADSECKLVSASLAPPQSLDGG